MSKPLSQKLQAEAHSSGPRRSAPEGGLAWDSLFLWLLSWAALLLGAEWLEADARSAAPVGAPNSEPTQEDAPPAEQPRWSGRVTYPDGRPAADLNLSAWPDPVEPLEADQKQHGFSPVYAVSDAEGRFTFEPRVDVRHSFEPQLLDFGDLRDSSGVAPRWDGNGEVTWIYDPFPEFWFTVCDADGARLERFTFDTVQGENRLHDFGPTQWPYSRPQAERSQPLKELGRPGLHRLCIRAAGFVPRSVPVMPASRDEPLEVRMRPAGAFRARLLDAAGKPLPDQRLSLRIAPPTREWRIPAFHPCADGGVDEGNPNLYGMTFDWRTDAEGYFGWDQLDPALEYVVKMPSPTREQVVRIPRTAAGETRQLGDLRLAPPPGVPEGPL